jgi:hypothetical protein
MKRRLPVLILLLILSLSQIWSSEQDRYQAVLFARAIEAPEPPQIVHGYLVFTYAEPGGIPPRYVAAAFRHENYGELHIFSRTDAGLFALIYEIPPDVEEVAYRLIVDGVWTPDPVNPNTRSEAGAVLSSFSVPPEARPGYRPGGPRLENGRARFVLRRSDVQGRFLAGVGGSSFRFDEPFEELDIRLVGSFNDFDPFVHLLEYNEGEYRIDLALPPGNYGYYFLIEGKRVLDPGNPEFMYGERRSRYSRISVDF